MFSKTVSELESGNDMDEVYLDTVSNSQNAAWLTQIQENNLVKMDTGAEVTAISMNTYRHLKKRQLTTADDSWTFKNQFESEGNVRGINFSLRRHDETAHVFVVDGLKTNLPVPAIYICFESCKQSG